MILANNYQMNFESLNTNIVEKINIIDKIDSIMFGSIFPKIDNKNSRINNIEFLKNKQILLEKSNEYVEIRDYYKFKSTIYIVPYYTLLNQKMCKIKKINKYDYSNIDILIDSDTIKNEILELKKIYMGNTYNTKYTFYNDGKVSNKNLNMKLKKNYEKFKIFISSNNIYNLLDDYIYHIDNFTKQLEEIITDLQLCSINSNLKTMNTLISKYN